ncbi:MAG: acyltransferase family protein [Glaciecola sp.]
MERIKWLDMSRGLAIILLIVMHNAGALESRNFITKDTLDVIYGLLRIATPFFMFTFGLAFYITASKKIGRLGLIEYYQSNVLKRLLYILIGREIIVIILSFRHPEMAENLISILLFQDFSKGGEILIFYFFAFLVAPLNVLLLQKIKLIFYILFWLVVYSVSFYIGVTYVNQQSNNVLRFLFYDVYAFVPFLIVVATAMAAAKFYMESDNKEKFLKSGFLVGSVMCISGFLLLQSMSSDIWASLSVAEFKKPPYPGFLLFYLGEVFIVIALVAFCSERIPRFINRILSTLGRNTLVSYVTHYTFFASVPLAAALGGGAVLEVLALAVICTLTYVGITKWDARKANKKKST